MGIAIKIPDVDFSALNLGQVTTSSIPVTAISIQGESSVTGTTDAATYSVTYTPSNTTQQGVIWSIDSGSQYASINASTGKLTILSGANNSAVRIKATSTYNSSVVATKDISVTYTSQVIPLVSLSVTGDDTINNANNSATYDVTYNPSNTTQRGVTWSITSGSEYATINASTGVVSVLAGASSASVTIKATSSVDSTKFATKTITCTYQSAVIPVTAIAISGASTIDDDTNQSTYSVTYTPNNTTQTGVTWSIESGGTYASINASTGVVSVLSGASSASVVIKATSTHNASVVATKTITCTYHSTEWLSTIRAMGCVFYAPMTTQGDLQDKISQVTGAAKNTNTSHEMPSDNLTWNSSVGAYLIHAIYGGQNAITWEGLNYRTAEMVSNNQFTVMMKIRNAVSGANCVYPNTIGYYDVVYDQSRPTTGHGFAYYHTLNKGITFSATQFDNFRTEVDGAGGTSKLFLNDTEKYTQSIDSSWAGQPTNWLIDSELGINWGAAFTLGGTNGSGAAGDGFTENAYFKEVYIFNKILSASEIATIEAHVQ